MKVGKMKSEMVRNKTTVGGEGKNEKGSFILRRNKTNTCGETVFGGRKICAHLIVCLLSIKRLETC